MHSDFYENSSEVIISLREEVSRLRRAADEVNTLKKIVLLLLDESDELTGKVEQLEMQLAKDINVPRWISVEERLPVVSDVVLVIANGKPAPHITLHNAYLIASYWGDEGWIADGFNGWDALQVTYWMPLPETPKEG